MAVLHFEIETADMSREKFAGIVQKRTRIGFLSRMRHPGQRKFWFPNSSRPTHPSKSPTLRTHAWFMHVLHATTGPWPLQ